MIIKGKIYKLPKRFKDKWVKALRSGKYKQDKSKLLKYKEEVIDGKIKYISKFCCIGVACIINNVEKNIIKNQALISLDDFEKELFKNFNVPNILKGSVDENPLVSKLIQLNDGTNEKNPKTFNYIASYIERYL